jgi:sugar lactone lactonase YvrE
MRSLSTRRSVTLATALALAAAPLTASAVVGDHRADRIVGQPDATSNKPNASGFVDDKGLSSPNGVAFDASGNLFVADTLNHRVLGYRSPMTTDRVADIVIGQPDFKSGDLHTDVSASTLRTPVAIALDSAGNLYVSDSGNHRVLEYDRPFATDTVADRVFGQPDFTSHAPNNGGVLPGSLNSPTGIAVDSAGRFPRLWVCDFGNNRVLEYDNPTGTRGRPADHVLGQTTFMTNDSGTSRTEMDAPVGVAVDAQHNVWVTEFDNNRVLVFDDPFETGDYAADFVLGQTSFTTATPGCLEPISADVLCGPSAVTVDPNGNVYVCDTVNSRVLMYTSPYVTHDRVADRVFGQPDFASNTASTNTSASALALPTGVAIDPAGNVAIADSGFNRVVLLEAPTPIVTSIAVKVSPKTGQRKLVVRGFGMVAGSAVVEVNGTPLATTKYKEPAADGSARRLVATDPNLDALVPPGVQVTVTVFNALTGSRSAPIPFTR